MAVYVPLRPAPAKVPTPERPRVSFLDLPAELRIEIYKLALEGVVVHILPPNAEREKKIPHALTRTTRQVRNEVLPLIHALCPIQCAVTDFNFDGLLLWMARVPPHEERNLVKNGSLKVHFNTSNHPQRSMDSLRKWLHMRSDKHRPQPNWVYAGSTPSNKVCADLKRRCKRMKEYGKQKEMIEILKALQIQPLPEPLPAPPSETSSQEPGTVEPSDSAEPPQERN